MDCIIREKSWVEIHKPALLDNIQTLRQAFQPTTIMPIIKANAYGHGFKEICEILFSENVLWYGVCDFEDTKTLAQLMQKQPANSPRKILLLGPLSSWELKELANTITNAEICLTSPALVDKWLKLKNPPNAHLKCDTGMSRQGITLKDFPRILHLLATSDHASRIQGIMTHYANTPSNTHDPDHYLKKQLLRYKDFLSLYTSSGFSLNLCQGGASHSALLLPESRFDMVRLGISLYGLWPSIEAEQRSSLKLKEILTWKTRIMQIKQLNQGDQVGYGGTYTATQDTMVALLPVGYYHGYSRKMGSHKESHVLINGHKCPIVGTVSMTTMSVKLPTNTSGFYEGQEVTLVGKSGNNCLNLHSLAHWASTIHYEVATSIHPSIKRVVM